MARLKVLFVAPECIPFAKTGGLGDVAGALPLALAAHGHDVRVVMPRYDVTKSKPAVRLAGPLGVPFGPATRWAGVFRAELTSGRPGRPKVPLYLLEHDALYGRDGVYGGKSGGYGDNLERYAFLSRGAIELARYLGFSPDVIHVHDWPTCLVPLYLDTVERGTPIARAATVLTIHNMAYQGVHPRNEYPMTGLPWDARALGSLELSGTLNLLKAGITHSTIVSTVSPRYAREIQTREGGEGLDGLLRMRGSDVIGVLNGIDEDVWDPETDPHIPAHFSSLDLTGKAECKAALQRSLGLPEEPGTPLLGVVSRLAEQKGIDVLASALPSILAMDTQVIVLGSGDADLEGRLTRIASGSQRFRVWRGMNEALAHQIEAGSDLFLMPSRYEPCGLNQMYSQRYGTLPVVRAIGGLDDTVENGKTGFKFDDLTPEALAATVAWAVGVYRDAPEHFRAMQVRAMQKPMGWQHAARHYEALYRLAMLRRRR